MNCQNNTKSFDPKRKCGICSNDFTKKTAPNNLISLECGCVFHKNCLYKCGNRGPTYSCPNSESSSKPKNGMARSTKNMDLAFENSQLRANLIELLINEKTLKSENSRLMSENQKLITENEKLMISVDQHRVTNETLTKERDTSTWEMAKLKAERLEPQLLGRPFKINNPSKKQKLLK